LCTTALNGYRTGIAVFDRNDPRKLLYRSDTPAFAP
jgi:predicted GH43/DUF377 family glycosyl hydrolase